MFWRNSKVNCPELAGRGLGVGSSRETGARWKRKKKVRFEDEGCGVPIGPQKGKTMSAMVRRRKKRGTDRIETQST